MRTLRAPGIEVNEFDRSYYSAEASLDNPATFAMGFANKGPDYDPMFVYSLNDFVNTYGIPSNEAEKYFYNAAKEVFENGGLFIGAKLPYNNTALSNFKFVEYSISSESSEISADYSNKNCFDNFRKYRKIEIYKKSGKTISDMDLSIFDSYKINTKKPTSNNFIIVDISKKHYVKDKNLVKIDFDNEYIGIVPVIVSPLNALYYQNTISADDISANIKYNTVNGGFTYAYLNNDSTIDYDSTLSDHDLSVYDPSIPEINFFNKLSAENNFEQTVSKIAASYFPNILHKNETALDTEYLKQIGIVVFAMVKEPSNNGKISFTPLESYIGSFDPTAKNEATGASIFIDTVVNNSSRYINIFSNIQNTDSSKFDTYAFSGCMRDKTQQKAISIGFKSTETESKISLETTKNAIDIILEKMSDRNRTIFDVLIDAGVSNIAQYIDNKQSDDGDGEYAPESDDQEFLKDNLATWRSVINKYKHFCENTRKDCMFIADGPRNLCLIGNTPVVRKSNIMTSVKKSIIPNIKYLTGIETSYGAGYLNWFYCYDRTRREFLWLPPSIKMGGVYSKLTSMGEFWKAPAGVSNAALNIADVYDVAFNPTIEEAGVIYDNNWNYAMSYPLYGIIPEGQKTFQKNKTAFDRVNVRRTFLGIEQSVYRLSISYLYEGLTERLINKFNDSVNEILYKYKQADAILDYSVMCNSKNNTPETIDNNELHCTVAIKPVKTVEWIILNFICTNQGANVEEIISDYTRF